MHHGGEWQQRRLGQSGSGPIRRGVYTRCCGRETGGIAVLSTSRGYAEKKPRRMPERMHDREAASWKAGVDRVALGASTGLSVQRG